MARPDWLAKGLPLRINRKDAKYAKKMIMKFYFAFFASLRFDNFGWKATSETASPSSRVPLNYPGLNLNKLQRIGIRIAAK